MRCADHSHQNNGTLELRTLKCVSLGFLDSKFYKTIISKDVIFNENIRPCLSGQIAKIDSTSTKDRVHFEVEPYKPVISKELTQTEIPSYQIQQDQT